MLPRRCKRKLPPPCNRFRHPTFSDKRLSELTMTTSTKIATTVSVLALLAVAAPLVSAQQPNPNATTTQQTPTSPTPGTSAGGNQSPRTVQGTNPATKQGTNRVGQAAGQKKGQKTTHTGMTLHGKNMQGKTATRGRTAMHHRAYGYRPLNQHRRHRQQPAAPAHSS
jgi:hypothetical protein